VNPGPATARPGPAGTPGPLLFARYAYPPNELGYCGPGDPAELFGTAAEGTDLPALSRLASRFEGAWPYLQLIAASNGVGDPLDPAVVEAYWVGNRLLGRVPAAALVSSLADRFEDPVGRRFEPVAAAVPLGGVCHHNFHVFAVYPWLGLLKAGIEGAPLTVLDRCRIRWGRVESVSGDLVTVRNQVLSFEGSRLSLGPDRLEVARRGHEGVGLAPDLAPGDMVSLHWDWVCDQLSSRAMVWLRWSTATNLAAVNALATPGPAAACGA